MVLQKVGWSIEKVWKGLVEEHFDAKFLIREIYVVNEKNLKCVIWTISPKKFLVTFLNDEISENCEILISLNYSLIIYRWKIYFKLIS